MWSKVIKDFWKWFKFSSQSPNLRIGRLGEKYAQKYLSKKGMKFLMRNFRCKKGEIDLVFREGDILVFVEVKTRTRQEGKELFARPASAVNFEKRRHIRESARSYLRMLHISQVQWRSDIVEVILDSRERLLLVNHIPGIHLYPWNRKY